MPSGFTRSDLFSAFLIANAALGPFYLLNVFASFAYIPGDE